MNDLLKGSIASKTMWLGHATSALAVLNFVQDNATVVLPLIGATPAGPVMTVLAVAIYVLRMVTTRPLADKAY